MGVGGVAVFAVFAVFIVLFVRSDYLDTDFGDDPKLAQVLSSIETYYASPRAKGTRPPGRLTCDLIRRDPNARFYACEFSSESLQKATSACFTASYEDSGGPLLIALDIDELCNP